MRPAGLSEHAGLFLALCQAALLALLALVMSGNEDIIPLWL